jgi:hypothetical protein
VHLKVLLGIRKKLKIMEIACTMEVDLLITQAALGPLDLGSEAFIFFFSSAKKLDQ